MIGYSNSLHAEPAKGTAAFGRETSADCAILPAMDALYDRIVAHDKPVRRVYVNCNDVHPRRRSATEHVRRAAAARN